MVFSQLGVLCEPSDNISEQRRKDKWCSYYYETGEYKGSMLVSVKKGRPEDVKLKLSVSGWYKIYVGLYAPGYEQTEVELKLSSEEAFMHLATSLDRTFSEHYVEEVFWRNARLDGEDIIIGKHTSFAADKTAAIAWIRLERMTEEELADYRMEQERQDTKRIYATNDMHGMLFSYDMSVEGAWKSVVQDYVDSDVEWLAIENIAHNDGKIRDCDTDDFAFARDGDRAFYEQYQKYYSYDVLKKLNAYGKSRGLKMCVSMRVCEWGMEFPWDRIHFEQDFVRENAHLHCIDRDGDVTDYMSFMYPEVQEHIIGEFVKMSQTGCDAVQVLFSRGWPFILFEEPFLKRFFARYQVDARTLPLDDARIIALKCEVMTEFMSRLRKRIAPQVEIHAKVLFSMYDCNLVGLDVKAWAEQGLVQRVVSDERRIREVLPEGVLEQGRINLELYKKYVREREQPVIRYDYDRIFEPLEDSKGILCGPKSQRERIEEFVALEKYGMTVYIEIMPRAMPVEQIRAKALEIYAAGCGHIGLWDTYARVKRKIEWNMWKRLGHKEELGTLECERYRTVRLNRLGDKNVRTYKPMWGG